MNLQIGYKFSSFYLETTDKRDYELAVKVIEIAKLLVYPHKPTGTYYKKLNALSN